MFTPPSAQRRLLPLVLLLIAAGAGRGPAPPSGAAANNGTLTLLNDLRHGYRPAGQRAVSVGKFQLRLGGRLPAVPAGSPLRPDFLDSNAGRQFVRHRTSLNGHNAFARMTLNGTLTVLHNFSAQEGIPYVLPLMASDGNFYGISGIGTSTPPNSTSAMV